MNTTHVPLKIANAPVLMPPSLLLDPIPARMPLLPRPEDPLIARIDPRKPLSERDASLAFETFLGAQGFFVLLSGWLLVVFAEKDDDKEFEIHEVMSEYPLTFGGLYVV